MKKNGNLKSYCNSICTGCNSLFFVKTANRYCYDDKYNLPQIPNKVVYKKNKISHTIATGVIGHSTHKTMRSDDASGMEPWEKNFKPLKHENTDTYIHIVKETCKELKVNYDKFIRVFKKISKEMKELDNDSLL